MMNRRTFIKSSLAVPDPRLENILEDFRNRIESVEVQSVTSSSDTTIHSIGGTLYGFHKKFPVPTKEWNVIFPPGKKLDPNGTFLCHIWGMNFGDTYYVIPGYNGIDVGIQFRLTTVEWPAGVEGFGMFQLIDSTPIGVTSVIQTLTLPIHDPLSGLQGCVVRFQ